MGESDTPWRDTLPGVSGFFRGACGRTTSMNRPARRDAGAATGRETEGGTGADGVGGDTGGGGGAVVETDDEAD